MKKKELLKLLERISPEEEIYFSDSGEVNLISRIVPVKDYNDDIRGVALWSDARDKSLWAFSKG